MNESDFWIELYKQHPELFNVVKSEGKNVLKIITSKLKEKFSAIREGLKDKKIGNLVPLLNSTETKKYINIADISCDEKHKNLRKYMDSDDWTIFILGQKALIEKQAMNMDEVLKIKREAINLKGQRGVILINFVLQGYFDELIIPILEYQIKEIKIDSKIIVWFKGFINEFVNFFPRAIWVKSSTNKLEIKKELIKRCVSHHFRHVNVHTIKKLNIDKIEDVLKELATDKTFPDFDYKIVDDVKPIEAVTFEIVLT